ncbi:DUF423 domain-containing protein [Flexibacterium corallicola]|uniref:DUF423 domain-containing protein n=1 Tax=Flexibacterium corallicola TaxID=3037259 RepID=UPI00286EF9D2|nr:DUF423 domain-containing protein [Pseudovibrio sp. M1P-2-3]
MTNEVSYSTAGLRAGLILGGFCGVTAIITAAAASHMTTNPFLGIISSLTMMHAAAFVALGLAYDKTGSKLVAFGMILIFAGLSLFCGDLGLRMFVGTKLFDKAAPTGGFLMILGWLNVLLAGLFGFYKRA